jgi:hypothetical protein
MELLLCVFQESGGTMIKHKVYMNWASLLVDQLALLICSSFYFSLIFFLHSPASFFFKSIAGIMYIMSHAFNWIIAMI